MVRYYGGLTMGCPPPFPRAPPSPPPPTHRGPGPKAERAHGRGSQSMRTDPCPLRSPFVRFREGAVPALPPKSRRARCRLCPPLPPPDPLPFPRLQRPASSAQQSADSPGARPEGWGEVCARGAGGLAEPAPRAWGTAGTAPAKRGRPTPQLEGPHQSVGVHHPNSRGHTEVWESITPTRGVTPKCGSPSPILEGSHRSVGVHHSNLGGHQPNSGGPHGPSRPQVRPPGAVGVLMCYIPMPSHTTGH